MALHIHHFWQLSLQKFGGSSWLLLEAPGRGSNAASVRARDDSGNAGSTHDGDLTSNLVSRSSIDRPNCASPRQARVMFVCREQRGTKGKSIG